MNHRDEFVTYIFTFDLLKFLVYQFLGPLSSRFASTHAVTLLQHLRKFERLTGHWRRRRRCFAQL